MTEDWKINPLREMARGVGVPYKKKHQEYNLLKILNYLLGKVKIKRML